MSKCWCTAIASGLYQIKYYTIILLGTELVCRIIHHALIPYISHVLPPGKYREGAVFIPCDHELILLPIHTMYIRMESN